jgi:CDP-paratose synthetase
MKTILITGINGFLGSHLAKALYTDYNIIGLEYSMENHFRIRDLNLKVYSIESGIPDTLFSEQTIETIIHTATFYGRHNELIKTIAHANIFMPFELLDKAIAHHCSVFINTDTVLDRFINPYALTKRHFQEWLFLRCHEIKVINIKLEHIYGQGCSNTNFITEMIQRLKQNETSIDLTYGEQKRDFVYIDDIVSAYETILCNIIEIKEAYSEFQVATGQLISIKELMIYLKEINGSSSDLKFGAIPYRENELMNSKTDNASLIQLGWHPKYSIKDGLKTLSSNL